MKFLFTATLLTVTSLLYGSNYSGSSFDETWETVIESPYERRITTEITMDSFFNAGKNLILGSAKRTVSDESDVLPYFNKLLHANGTCLRGYWSIDQENEYSGFFKKDSEGLIIARASTTLSNTKRGTYRGFALAGKVFPTLDESKTVRTANFFTIDNLIGTYANNFTRVELTNEPSVAPPLSPSLLGLARVGLAVSTAFGKADSNPGIRQVYSLSYLTNEGEVPRTPKWMMLKGDNSQFTNNGIDFRDELAQHVDENGTLRFGIYTADKKSFLGKKQWRRLGWITFESVIESEGCDHRLHFHHHKFVNNVK